MGSRRVNRPRGTRDFLPEEMEKRRHVEGILRRTAENFGYREIATPTFEHLELFTMKSGEEVVEQLYAFEDRGKRKMALRPELTAAAMRLFSEEMAFLPRPVKVYYFGNCFRYERPQKGRYREFWQFGAECIGPSTPLAAAEIVALAYHAIRTTGLKGFVLRLGHLEVLRGILEGLGIEQRTAMTLIDKGDMVGLNEFFIESGVLGEELLMNLLNLKGRADAIERAGEMTEGLNRVTEGLARLEEISSLLKGAGIEHIIDFGIARGLDYYTGMVFEVDVPSLGAEKQICGGGEYSLNEIFGLNVEGTSGFAIGFDRLVLALENEGIKFPVFSPSVGVIPMSGTGTEAFILAQRLREAGIPTELEITGRALKKALSRMKDTRFTLIVGESELERGNVVLRDMKNGEQEEVPVKKVVGVVRERLKGTVKFREVSA